MLFSEPASLSDLLSDLETREVEPIALLQKQKPDAIAKIALLEQILTPFT